MSLQVNSMGAELFSIKKDGKELLWQGDDRVWSGRAPVLFPIVCGLKDDQYTLDGRAYTMPGHGFAKTMEFALLEREAHSIAFLLRDDERSMAMYPFRFRFVVRYILSDSGLTQEYTVTNDSNRAMPYSLGVHTALNCPLHPGERFEDYRITFPMPITMERRIKRDNLMTSETMPLLSGGDTLPLCYELFDEMAVALIGMPVKTLTLENAQGSYRARYRFEDYADLGIWTMRDAPFVCIEPWNGYDSHVDGVSDILQKPGIMLLQSGMSREFTNSIEFEVR